MINNDLRRDVGVDAGPVTSGFKVDISRGQRIGRVSSEWFSRPDDERYLSLNTLHDAVRARAERATARTVETKSLRVEARTNDVSRLALGIPGRAETVAPTHWSFGQLCGLVGAPAGCTRPVFGSNTSAKRPLVPATLAPPMKWSMSRIARGQSFDSCRNGKQLTDPGVHVKQTIVRFVKGRRRGRLRCRAIFVAQD